MQNPASFALTSFAQGIAGSWPRRLADHSMDRSAKNSKGGFGHHLFSALMKQKISALLPKPTSAPL
jgi:hypothetical protein